jgi:cytoskeletal protein CcmA (bactofilin family)
MLPNFKRSDSEPPKVSPSLTPTGAPPMPGASARGIGIARPAERNAPSVIGPDLTINGNLVSRGEVQIDGEVQGDIQGTYVVIGEKARITGGIVAEEIVVRGHVMGSVRGKRVMLQSSSHVEGDIFHQALAIEQGAFFEGKSRRSDDPTAEAKPDIPSMHGTSSLG